MTRERLSHRTFKQGQRALVIPAVGASEYVTTIPILHGAGQDQLSELLGGLPELIEPADPAFAGHWHAYVNSTRTRPRPPYNQLATLTAASNGWLNRAPTIGEKLLGTVIFLGDTFDLPADVPLSILDTTTETKAWIGRVIDQVIAGGDETAGC